MSERKKYTRDEAEAVIIALEQAILARTDTYDTPALFIQQHPWTRKFVCVGYSEAEQLFHESRKQGFSIQPRSMNDIEVRWRTENNRPFPLRFGNSGQGAQFLFCFDQIEDGVFTPTTGSF